MTIDELIAALEKAEGPSRELDRDIHESAGQCAHRESKYWCIEDGNDFDSGFDCVKCGSSKAWEIEVPKYTASLDAALTLVPEGMEWSLTTLYGEATAEVGLNNTTGMHSIGRRKDGNVAIALCIAALRVRRNA